jgi:hypothetical protein
LPDLTGISQKKEKYMPKVGEVAKFRDKGPSVEEARAAMLAAGETPQGLLVSVAKDVAKAAGGNLPVTPQAAPSRVNKKTPTQARLTLINADGTDGETALITAKSTFELNSLIQRNNALAQKNKKRIRVEFIDPEAPVAQEEVVVQPTIQVTESIPAAPVVNDDDNDPVEVTENNKFRCEIRQEDGEWVAEIAYKTGGGVERFTAPSRKALNIKLLEGKAHATLRVREAIRREKYGVELDQFYTLPDYMTQEAFDALPEPAQRGIVDAIAMQEALLLHKLHPEFYITEENSKKMQQFLNHKGLPFTVTNLTYAYEELAEADELETRPTPKTAPSVSQPQTPAGDSAAAVQTTPVASATSALPAPVSGVRKRGTTGLQPAQSSAVTTELETIVPEEPAQPSEPSEAELRSMPLSELKKLQAKSLKPQGQRRF